MASDSGSRLIGVLSGLSVALVVLKVCGLVDWSWWMVLAPIWGVAVAFFLGLFVVVVFLVMREGYRDWRTHREYRRRQAAMKVVERSGMVE